jgi:hypothetical protein
MPGMSRELSRRTSQPDSSNLGRHRRWQIGFFVLFFVSLGDVKISGNKSRFLTICDVLLRVSIPFIFF